MKKLLILILVVLGILVAASYLFIPNKIIISHSIYLQVNRPGLYRNLLDDSNWPKWWPGQVKNEKGMQLMYKGEKFYIEKKQVISLVLTVSNSPLHSATELNIIPATDSVQLLWETTVSTSNNPIMRALYYFKSQELSGDMREILDTMQLYFSKTKNVYNLDIREDHVTDSTLVSTYSMGEGYPSTAFEYALIDSLRNYISLNGARETNFPMLNVSTSDSVHFLTRVAIPIDRILPDSGNISYKWMLGGGNILVAEVKGGPLKIGKAVAIVGDYATDHHRVAPAIPFISLVTDRRKEPDTSRWVSRIYFPVE
jgi:hypothetical protein